MKTRRYLASLLFASATTLLWQGCYTRVLTSDGERSHAVADSTAGAPYDTVYTDNYYYRPLYHPGFEYYYPSMAYYSPYDPWFYYDPYYNPWWWCGTPFVVYRYPFYEAYPRVAFVGYGFHTFGARYTYAPGSAYPTRNSGVRRTGAIRGTYGSTYVGTRGSAVPAGPTYGTRTSGAVRSQGAVRSFMPGAGSATPSPAPTYRRSAGRSGAPASRQPQGTYRTQGTARTAPAPSFTPRQSPPPSSGRATGGGGTVSGGSHRSSGGGRSRGR